MLSVETSTRLAELFWSVIEGERQVEIVRQVLAEQDRFSPYAAFRELDRFHNGFLTSADLVEFLRKNAVDVGEREGYLLLRACDSNSDGRLSYSDFTAAVLPDSTDHLDLVKSRAHAEEGAMAAEVLYAIVRVFERELQHLRDVERAKEALICRSDFNLLDAFRRVDQLDDSVLTRDSVRGFLMSHAYRPSADDIEAFMRRVDRDHDDAVNYVEFVDCVLPAEPYYHVRGSLNSSTSQSYSQSLRSSGALRGSYELSPRGSANRHEMRISDREEVGSPLKAGMRTSFKQSNHELTRSTLSPSSYSSPIKASPGHHSSYTAFSPLKSSVDRPNKFSPLPSSRDSPRRPSPEPVQDQFLSTPLRSSRSQHHHSPLRTSSPMRAVELRLSHLTPKPQKQSFLTPRRSVSKSPRVSSKARTPSKTLRGSRSLIFHELIKSFASQISLDKELDIVRQKLSLRADFNLEDAYRMFDNNTRGFITAKDMSDTLNFLDLHPSTEDLYTWFRRFDQNSDGRLTFRDFCCMFTPQQCEYRKLLKNRPSRNVVASKRRGVFSLETQALMKKAIALLLEVEVAADGVRARLVSQPSFDPKAAFAELDLDENGYITLDELRIALQACGKYATERELLGLLSRYDRDKDGKISYADFIQEVTPKAHLRAI